MPPNHLPGRHGAAGKAKGHAGAQPFVNLTPKYGDDTSDKARMGLPVLIVKVLAALQRSGQQRRYALYSKGLQLRPTSGNPLAHGTA